MVQRAHLLLPFLEKEQATSASLLANFAQRRHSRRSRDGRGAAAARGAAREDDIVVVVVVVMVVVVVVKGKERSFKEEKSPWIYTKKSTIRRTRYCGKE